VPVIGHLVGIANVRNSGAAFGFAPAGATFFLVASAVVAVGLVIYVARNPSTLQADAVLGLIMGGTIGNGYDRIVYGTVTDFVNFHFWPVFNVADSAISIGVVALIAGYLLRKPAAK
jgi:signal peptidase II